MDRYAVFGHPVAHSRSPAIHARFAALTGQQLSYERRELPLDGFVAGMIAARREGFKGGNITVPFKFEAFGLAQRLSPRAQLAQACNTLSFDSAEVGGEIGGDNTDGIGLVRDITLNAGVALAGQRVLLVGAGGAAAGVLGPLLAEGPAELVVANRSTDRADALVARHASWAQTHGVHLSARGLEKAGEGYDVVVNGTAASLAGGDIPVSANALRAGCLAVDMMYGPAAHGFATWAQAHGAQVRDGLGMLVEQAAESFFIWRGVRPPTASVLAEMRAALNASQQGQAA